MNKNAYDSRSIESARRGRLRSHIIFTGRERELTASATAERTREPKADFMLLSVGTRWLAAEEFCG